MNLSYFVKRDLDIPLILAVCITSLLGITMIYSATYNWDLGAAGNVYQKQILWTLFALVALTLTIAIPLKFYYAFAYILYGIAMLLLVLVLELVDWWIVSRCHSILI